MRRHFGSTMLLAVALLPGARGYVFAQAGTVEKVEVQGLNRMTGEAFRIAFGIKPGDPYSPAAVRSAFRDLWDLGLFADITVEAETGSRGGKVLVVKVKERPVLVSVTYEDNKVLTRTQIEDRLKEKDIRLALGKPIDSKAAYEAASAIRDFLGEKGFLDASVSYRLNEVTQTSYGLDYSIRPGGKTRIRKIVFSGNKVFSDRKLRKQLRLTRAWRWWWPWSAKSLYHPIKWDQDVGSVRELYQDVGFLDVEIRPPAIEVKEVVKDRKAKKKKGEQESGAEPTGDAGSREQPPATEPEKKPTAEPLSPRKVEKRAKKQLALEEKERKKEERARRKAEPKVKRWVYLTVPVSEGKQYKTGEVTFSGNTILTDEQIRAMIPLREGQLLSNAVLRHGVDLVQRAYADRGHLYATAVRQIQRREGEEAVADIRVSISEDKPYHIARVEFRGNTATQDRVLRREVRLNEGDLFNRTRLDLSRAKINQLGYFEVKDEPTVEPVEGENRVRVTFRGEEKGRNEIQVGGGYSGLDGAFFTGYYSTRNFLGRGQIASASLQVGGRSNRYTISLVEPWFLGTPTSLGFSVFRRDIDYGGNLRSSGKGGGVVIGRQIGFFANVQAAYNFESVSSSGFNLNGDESTNRISSVTPSFLYNRVNNPYRPSRGWSLATSAQVAGGALGGDTNFYRPMLIYSGYRRALRRSFLGFHAEVGLIRAFQGGTTAGGTSVSGLPRFQRVWLGGDTQGPRVFETRSITPLRFVALDSQGRIIESVKDPTGRPVSRFDRNGDQVLDSRDLVELGGDRFFLLQSEYVIPFNESVEAAFFLDVGNAIFEDTSWGFTDARVSAGVEMRFYLPVFPVPLRLIYGFPIRKLPEDRTSGFTFSIGRSF